MKARDTKTELFLFDPDYIGRTRAAVRAVRKGSCFHRLDAWTARWTERLGKAVAERFNLTNRQGQQAAARVVIGIASQAWRAARG